MLQPGEPFPAEASSSIASLASTATSTATSTQGAATVSSSSHHGLSTGAIVGIAVAGAAALTLALALCFFIGRTKKLKQQINRGSTFGTAPGMFGPPAGSFGPTPVTTPGTTYRGGTAYVPIEQPDMPYTHRSQRSDVPPYTAELSEADMNSDLASMRSMSPRSPFQDFGAVHSPPQSPPLYRYVLTAPPEHDGIP